MAEPKSQGPDLVPVIVLILIVAALFAGAWAFPHIQKIIQREDCISIGRNDCG